nr:AAA family ATPase [Oculatella sp. FACHB-28]
MKEYGFILIDCPPSLGILSQISLVASTHVLVPIPNSVQSFNGNRFFTTDGRNGSSDGSIKGCRLLGSAR